MDMRRRKMKRIIGALTATLLSLSFGMAFADEKAMKEHQEMGKIRCHASRA